MTKWNETREAEDFIASGDSRKTSKEIMQAIAFFARNVDEAEALWRGDGLGVICASTDLWEYVTNNGLRQTSEFLWGASGSHWWERIEATQT